MIKQQDYTGMDNMTLLSHEQQIKDYKENCEFSIAHAKEQINNLRQIIKDNETKVKVANNELLKIKDAMRNAGDVSYEHVIMVKRTIEKEYVGKNAVQGYYAMRNIDWKESVRYFFEVRKVNVLGAAKGIHTIFTSVQFGSAAKVELNDAIVSMAQQFGVKKIYLDDGVKINRAKIKAAIPDIVIR